MRETDARRLKHTELTELRKRGVSAVQDGQRVTLVAKVLGIQRSTLLGGLPATDMEDGMPWMLGSEADVRPS